MIVRKQANALAGIFCNVLLVFCSCVFGLVLTEMGYRLYLSGYFRQTGSVAAAPSFSVFSSSFWEYNEQIGFDYPRNHRTDHTQISKGVPVLCFTYTSDSAGNSGRDPGVVSPQRKVFVFGDSFTFVQHGPEGGITWPQLLQSRLNETLGGGIEVRNYSRDGAGILQIFDAAEFMVEKERPDLVIVAFITDDMQRKRYWRVTKRQPAGPIDVFTSVDPNLSFSDRTYARTTIVDPRTNRAWCDSLRKSGDRNDPLLKSVIEKYRALQRDDAERFERRVDPWTLRHSFVFARLRHYDPFFGIPTRQWQPSLSLDDFSADGRFVAATERLQRSGVPILLVWLPQFQEMVEGKHIFSVQQRSLYASLLRITGFPLIDVLPAYPLAESDAAAFYSGPHDLHPSLKGIEFYAESIARKLEPYLCYLGGGGCGEVSRGRPATQ